MMLDKKLTQKFDFPKYTPSQKAFDVLKHGNIMADNESPQDLLRRVVAAMYSVEYKFNTPIPKIKKLAGEFSELITKNYLMPGTPTLTNAGRYKSAVSSCVVIPVNLLNKKSAKKTIKSYYKQNMGSGFDFTKYEDPVNLLTWINEISRRETATGLYDRYIGNMGTLHVSHPKILDFINSKVDNKKIKHFNISVDIGNDFMEAIKQGKSYVLSDSKKINPSKLLMKISENAWLSGDPGLVFMERMNSDNPIAEISPYVSTPPCSEMGLSEGETCQFGYINLARFVVDLDNGGASYNYAKLEKTVRVLTRALDNAIEYGIGYYPTGQSTKIASLKRKIGIGVCGLADLLLKLGIPYDSVEARKLGRDILSFINYVSKEESIKLAEERGSCLAMAYPDKNEYIAGDYLINKYAINPTRTVSSNNWKDLSRIIKNTWNLRNILTTSLPPTGRASILLGVNSSIEPFFSLYDSDGVLKKNIDNYIFSKPSITQESRINTIKKARLEGSFQNINNISDKSKACLKIAKEISIEGHLKMVGELAGIKGVYDEAASKTLNLPGSASVNDVKNIFLTAFSLGLKNISVYRDGSKTSQPEKL